MPPELADLALSRPASRVRRVEASISHRFDSSSGPASVLPSFFPILSVRPRTAAPRFRIERSRMQIIAPQRSSGAPRRAYRASLHARPPRLRVSTARLLHQGVSLSARLSPHNTVAGQSRQARMVFCIEPPRVHRRVDYLRGWVAGNSEEVLLSRVAGRAVRRVFESVNAGFVLTHRRSGSFLRRRRQERASR